MALARPGGAHALSAAALAVSGHVRVNGQRIDLASRAVRVGDVVTVALDQTVRVLKVAGFAERRGPAASAHVLAEDLTPAPGPDQAARPATAAPDGVRQPGAGRPTKHERRAIAHLRREDEFRLVSRRAD